MFDRSVSQMAFFSFVSLKIGSKFVHFQVTRSIRIKDVVLFVPMAKSFKFLNHKAEYLFHQRKNPRKIHWTVIYRRMHRKGTIEEVAKRRTRRTIKTQRAIVGAPLELIKARRFQKPEVRAAAREEALRVAKEEARKKQAEKKALAQQTRTHQPKHEKVAKVIRGAKPTATSR